LVVDQTVKGLYALVSRPTPNLNAYKWSSVCPSVAKANWLWLPTICGIRLKR